MSQNNYERTELTITEFDKKDVIATSETTSPDLDPYEGGFFFFPF